MHKLRYSLHHHRSHHPICWVLSQHIVKYVHKYTYNQIRIRTSTDRSTWFDGWKSYWCGNYSRKVKIWWWFQHENIHNNATHTFISITSGLHASDNQSCLNQFGSKENVSNILNITRNVIIHTYVSSTWSFAEVVSKIGSTCFVAKVVATSSCKANVTKKIKRPQRDAKSRVPDMPSAINSDFFIVLLAFSFYWRLSSWSQR